MTGLEFRRNINNFYFDPRDLLDQNNIMFNRLMSLIHSNYLSFYGDLPDLSLFLNTVIDCDFGMKIAKYGAHYESSNDSLSSKHVFWSHLLALGLMLTNQNNSKANEKTTFFQFNFENEISRYSTEINKKKRSYRRATREFNLTWQDIGYFEQLRINQDHSLPDVAEERDIFAYLDQFVGVSLSNIPGFGSQTEVEYLPNSNEGFSNAIQWIKTVKDSSFVFCQKEKPSQEDSKFYIEDQIEEVDIIMSKRKLHVIEEECNVDVKYESLDAFYDSLSNGSG
jgi:hypothetical protein